MLMGLHLNRWLINLGMKELRKETNYIRFREPFITDNRKKNNVCVNVCIFMYFVNLMQNCVKYLRVDARLSLMIGTFCLMCMMIDVT